MIKKGPKAWIATVALFLIIDACLILFYAPIEITQGTVQKIFYWHVPSAMAMMALFLLGGIASTAYLLQRRPKADAIAISFIEVGFLFCTIALVTGSLWARPIWGAWWTWEPRLTSTLFVWIIFCGYFILRGSLEQRDDASLYGAVLAIFGCLDIPIIYFAVKLWRGMHPQILQSRANLPDRMWVTLVASMLTVGTLASLLVFLRYKKEIKALGKK